MIRNKFEELCKKAGFKSISDFCKNTINPKTGKARNSTGVIEHLEKKAPYDFRTLQGYAEDLGATYFEIFSLFHPEEVSNIDKFLKNQGFKENEEGYFVKGEYLVSIKDKLEVYKVTPLQKEESKTKLILFIPFIPKFKIIQEYLISSL